MSEQQQADIEPLAIEERIGGDGIALSVFGHGILGVAGARVAIPPSDALDYLAKMKELDERGDVSSMTLAGSNMEVECGDDFGNKWNDETVVYRDQVTFRAEDAYAPEEYVEFVVSLRRIEDYLEGAGLMARADRRTDPETEQAPGLSF